MEIQSTQFLHGVQGLQGPHRNVPARETAQPSTDNTSIRDEVRFSEEAVRMSEVNQTEESSIAGVRLDLVNRIKSEIAAGTYDTPDKMDIAFDRLIGQLSPR